MILSRRLFGKYTLGGLVTAIFSPAVLFTTACGTSVVAGLVSTLGGAAASIATALGDSALAEKIATDTAAVVTAVNNWKAGKGTSAIVVAVLNTVLSDINLIPVSPIFQTLIALAITTAESLITIFSAGTASGMKAAYEDSLKAGAPQDSDHFKTKWNGICDADARLAPVRIK